ncbi:MFS transporter [Streptomyces nojiriensis]|uniref:MFS transporter n=1 Tax=Streptomyces nojiriensis TaxID=66374 RepID=UPI0035D60678
MPTAPDAPALGARIRQAVIPEKGPRRTLVVATLINTFGNGLFITGGALYFIRAAGLSTTQVGAGLTIAGIVALTAGIPAGRLADRVGSRPVWMATLLFEAVSMLCFLFVRSFWLFVPIACVSLLAASASQAARLPLVRMVGGKTATKLRAYLRSMVNLGVSLGGLAAAIAVQVDTTFAYSLLIAGNAVSFAGCAAVVAMLPRTEPQPSTGKTSSWTSVRDKPFIAVTVLNGILTLQETVLSFVLPLWIVTHTDAPRWMVGTMVILNTVLVTLFQVAATRGVDSPSSAARAARAAGILLMGGFALMALSGHVPTLAAVGCLITAMLVHTLGELRYSAASFELSFGLAPQANQGEYGGLFGMGASTVMACGPLLLGLLILQLGTIGWFVLGGIVALSGALLPPVVRWAQRTPPRTLEPANL